MPTVMLATKLGPIEAAIGRLRARAAYPGQPVPDDAPAGLVDPDLVEALDGLARIVRELSEHRWTVE